MNNHLSTLLAVDPGTRELGVAILRGRDLLFYGVKTVTDRKNPARVLEVVSSYVRNLVKKYRPAHLAIEKLFITQKNSALLVVVAEQVKATARELNLPVYEYAPTAVRKRMCQTGRATKRQTAEILATRFPELKRYYLRTAKWEIDYYGNLFDAAAVGVICEEDLSGKRNADERETDNS